MHIPYRIGMPTRLGGIGIEKRALGSGNNTNNTNKPSTVVIIVSCCAGAIFVMAVIYAYIKVRKNKKSRKGPSKRYAYSQTSGNDDSTSGTSRSARAGSNAAAQSNRNGNNETTTVDRNTSVRSIMTLPVYRTKPNDNEQVLGREGERGGVDVVLEMPTAEEHEALREDEMETMYQIRVARRSQIADREERRQLRRDARQRGDSVALRDLNERARVASQSNTVSDLREEQQRLRNQRERAVSSVSYEGLGVARHDGTRLRANSQESERVGLLSDAASISLSTRSPSAISHRRERSASSLLSFDSAQDLEVPGSRSAAATPRRLSTQHSGGTAGSSPEIIGEADLGDFEIPTHDPPRYDDVDLDDTRSGATTPVSFNEPPPGYTGPSDARDQSLNAQVADMVDSIGAEGDLGARSSTSNRLSRNSSNSSRIPFPRLPSISLDDIPQIVVEPSSAYPRDRSQDR